ncbi:MAG TPA: AbrB/MazE/SpoVT family DNA-binding domain-containing protein [Candidatus Altiarchaeales archaeon]|nr:AbrB/MazE/SpoVT family DNA-binding domain-containing protein [Candidatus Altiarchaeales archaeon]HEX55415.1 AbrB/MazE/SpoVT family DNA-binding domain-containing protein [Candidatus Altiarchaeales archaeon]
MIIDVVKVTSKGQIVIPRDIREKLGIRKGTRLLVFYRGNEIMLKVLKNVNLNDNKISNAKSIGAGDDKIDDVELKVMQLLRMMKNKRSMDM